MVDALEIGMSKVLKLDQDKQTLSLIEGVGWDQRIVGDGKIPTGVDSQAGYTLQAKGPVILTNLKDEKRFHGPTLLSDHNVHSGMSHDPRSTRGSMGRSWSPYDGRPRVQCRRCELFPLRRPHFDGVDRTEADS